MARAGQADLQYLTVMRDGRPQQVPNPDYRGTPHANGHRRPQRTLQVPTTTTSKSLYSRAGRLVGWAFRETTGSAAAAIDLYDGADANGVLMGSIGMVANGGSVVAFGDNPHPFLEGVFLSVASGSVRGAVWVKDLDRSDELSEG